MTTRLLTLLQRYPNYKITGMSDHKTDWGELDDIRVMHNIETIRLIFGKDI